MDKVLFLGLTRALQSFVLPPPDDQFAILLARLDAIELARRAVQAELEASVARRLPGRSRPMRRPHQLPASRVIRRNLQRRLARRPLLAIAAASMGETL